MRVFPARVVRDFLVTRDLLLVFHPLPGLRMINHSAASRHPSAEGNFVPRRDEPSSPPLEGWWLAAGVVRDCGIRYLVPFVIASEAWRGDPVNKKSTAGVCPHFLCHSRVGGNRVY